MALRSELHYFQAIEKDVLSEVRGVTADNIDFKAFVKRKVILPPIDLQNQFAAFVEQIDKSKIPCEMEVAAISLRMIYGNTWIDTKNRTMPAK